MDYPKSIKQVPHSGQQFLAGVQSPMGQLRSLVRSSNHQWVNPPTIYKVLVHFVSKAKGFILQLGECLSSYDVTSLFTSVPIDPALKVIKDLLEKDEKLNDRTVFSVQDIIELLGFCLHNTYFCFQNKFYEQVEGAPMGLPVSPIVANLYMESFERKAIVSAINPPSLVQVCG